MRVPLSQCIAFSPSIVSCCIVVAAAAAAWPAVGQQSAGDHGHEHGTGAHGGQIVPLGRESYHVEPVFEKDGVVRLYILAADETRVQDVDRQTLTAYAKAPGAAASESFKLEPEPQEGDADGKTSRFRGVLPAALKDKPVDVTIPILRIAGERFRLGFASTVPGHTDAAMPVEAPDEEARVLYLTPGGRYTEADIEANGRRTARQAFAAFVPKHDLHPQPGDRICPITLTKANPACAWIIGGKSYEFCCPPCVDEFVKLAKEQPNQIKEPESYVK